MYIGAGQAGIPSDVQKDRQVYSQVGTETWTGRYVTKLVQRQAQDRQICNKAGTETGAGQAGILMCRWTGRYVTKLRRTSRYQDIQTVLRQTAKLVQLRGGESGSSRNRFVLLRERVRQVLMVHHQGWLRKAIQEFHGHLGVGDLVAVDRVVAPAADEDLHQHVNPAVRKKQEGNNRGSVLIKHLNMNQVNGLFSKLYRIKI